MINQEAVIAIRVKNPCATLENIATPLGITRERVRQILKGHGLPTTHWKPKKPEYVCFNCGTITHRKSSLCSPKCRHEYCNPLVECYNCGNLFRKRQSYLKRQAIDPRYTKKRDFCSLKCNGIIIGIEYGFVAHPENRRGGAKESGIILKFTNLEN